MSRASTPNWPAPLASQATGPRRILPWAAAGVVGLLFVAVHWHFLYRMFRIATSRWGGDWSHALLVPVISGYYLYLRRREIARRPWKASFTGLPLLFLGIFSYAWWLGPGRNDMLQGYSMILALFGLVLLLAGWKRMALLWFPVLYLAMGVKVSDRIWDRVAWELQRVAAHMASGFLKITSVDAQVTGSTIHLYQGVDHLGQLNVAEACSGLRMLMAFVALGLAMAFLVRRPWWQRLVMVALTVPIAILVNAGRVTVMAALFLVDPDLISGAAHTYLGMLMLIPAGGLFWLLGWVMEKLLIDEPEPADAERSPDAQQADESPQKQAAPASDPRDPQPKAAARAATGKRLGLGLAVGLPLAAAVGGAYAALLAALRPDLMPLGQTGAALLLAGLAVLAVGLGVLAHRLIKPRRHTDSGIGAALGLGVGVLLVSLLGLQSVVAATNVVLIKEPIPLRRPLQSVPDDLGQWELVREMPALTPEVIEALGTDQYLNRIYARGLGAEQAIARVHVAYYTGTADTVPHVPERCFVAGGVEAIGTDQTSLPLSGPGYQPTGDGLNAPNPIAAGNVFVPARSVPVTRFAYSDPRRPDEQLAVFYFFAANGSFLPTPDHVRLMGFDPRDRYAYYCKVELGVLQTPAGREPGEEAQTLLSELMPAVMACLPDWNKVQTQQWKDSATPAEK